MQSIQLIVGALFVSISPLALAADINDLFGKDDGCMEGPLEQFGRYIGDWKIEDESGNIVMSYKSPVPSPNRIVATPWVESE